MSTCDQFTKLDVRRSGAHLHVASRRVEELTRDLGTGVGFLELYDAHCDNREKDAEAEAHSPAPRLRERGLAAKETLRGRQIEYERKMRERGDSQSSVLKHTIARLHNSHRSRSTWGPL